MIGSINKIRRFDMHEKLTEMDAKEIQLPETTYIRDIETRVFQAIALQCLAKIEGISFLEQNLIDSLLRWDNSERIKGVHVEQDQKKHSVYIRIEVNILYGIPIPEKAEEIQNRLVAEITKFTGLHVACVHVVFKNLLLEHPSEIDESLEQEEKEK